MDATRPDRLGRPLQDLRVSVTDRCNFRCPYCMPAEEHGGRYRFLPRRDLLTYEEIERLTRIFVASGVSKVRLTGGEPLLRAELPKLVRRLAGIEGVEDLALTTNGVLLPRYANALRDAGLRRVTVSLDSLDDEVFQAMNARGFGVGRVLEGIAAAERAGLTPLKINCVVQRGVNDHTLLDLAERFRGTGHIVRFIEFMDVGTLNGWERSNVVPAQEILARLRRRFTLRPLPSNYPGEVAQRFAYDDGKGEVGIIASVSQPFCSGCTRARLTTEGRLFTCLFASEGTDLRGPLRAGASDEDLLDYIAGTWKERRDRYSEERRGQPLSPAARREMYQIGG